MSDLWTDPTVEAVARARDDGGDWTRTLFYWLVFLGYTLVLAWSAYDLGARETARGLICEPPAPVVKPTRGAP